MRALAVETRVPITFGIVATEGRPAHLLDLLDDAAAAGGRMIGQTHCRGISVLLSFKTKLPFDVLPEWQPSCARCPTPSSCGALARPDARATGCVDAATNGRLRGVAGVGAQARKPDFEGIRVYEQGLPAEPDGRRGRARRGACTRSR